MEIVHATHYATQLAAGKPSHKGMMGLKKRDGWRHKSGTFLSPPPGGLPEIYETASGPWPTSGKRGAGSPQRNGARVVYAFPGFVYAFSDEPRPPSDEGQPRFELADFGSQLARGFVSKVISSFGVVRRKLVGNRDQSPHHRLLEGSVLTTDGHCEPIIVKADFIDSVCEALGGHDGVDGTLVKCGLEGRKVIGILALDLVALLVGDGDHAGCGRRRRWSGAGARYPSDAECTRM